MNMMMMVMWLWLFGLHAAWGHMACKNCQGLLTSTNVEVTIWGLLVCAWLAHGFCGGAGVQCCRLVYIGCRLTFQRWAAPITITGSHFPKLGSSSSILS